MDTDTFQQQLKAKEEALLGQLARAGTRARESRNERLGALSQLWTGLPGAPAAT